MFPANKEKLNQTERVVGQHHELIQNADVFFHEEINV